MTNQEAHGQGVLWGYLVGQKRVSEYVWGEENNKKLSPQSAQMLGLETLEEIISWENGYRFGYLHGALEEELPSQYRITLVPEG